MAVGVVVLVSSKTLRWLLNALIPVKIYSIVEYGFVKGLYPIILALYELFNPQSSSKIAHGR